MWHDMFRIEGTVNVIRLTLEALAGNWVCRCILVVHLDSTLRPLIILASLLFSVVY